MTNVMIHFLNTLIRTAWSFSTFYTFYLRAIKLIRIKFTHLIHDYLKVLSRQFLNMYIKSTQFL